MNQLERLRIQQGYSRQELADKAAITRVSVYRYETGERVPDIYVAKRLAGALNCTLDDLVTEDGEQ